MMTAATSAPSTRPAEGGHFSSIEGFRGWLALCVVADHLVFFPGVDQTSRVLALVRSLGDVAVLVFVIISGFVIAELRLKKQEPYGQYIARRGLRLFPAYFLGLAAASATLSILPHALSAMQWITPQSESLHLANDMARTVGAHPNAHWALHLTLLHGLVPDSILPLADLVFLPPAWSLSLEWQFYLIAPLVIAGMQKDAWRVPIILIAGMLYLLYAVGALGHYPLPSTLAAAGFYFLIGIGTRLALGRLTHLPTALAIMLVILIVPFPKAVAPLLWGAFVVFAMRRPSDGAARVDTTGLPALGERVTTWTFRAVFDSPVAQWLGQRSYGIYVLHWPVICWLVILAPLSTLSPMQAFLALTAMAVPLTLVAAHAAHVLVEKPFIALGRSLSAGPREKVRAAQAG